MMQALRSTFADLKKAEKAGRTPDSVLSRTAFSPDRYRELAAEARKKGFDDIADACERKAESTFRGFR